MGSSFLSWTEQMKTHLKIQKPEIKEAWLKALRSGEYEQCRKFWRSRSGAPTYCCLGLLLSINETEITDASARKLSASLLGSEILHEDQNWINRSSEEIKEDEQNDSYSVMQKLINMNDNEGKNFTEIADWVEKNL